MAKGHGDPSQKLYLNVATIMAVRQSPSFDQIRASTDTIHGCLAVTVVDDQTAAPYSISLTRTCRDVPSVVA